MMESKRKRKCTIPKSARLKRLIAVVLLCGLIVSLLPLYSAALYSRAGVDDYRYGRTTHAVYSETHSVPQTVIEAGRVAAETYDTWQGSVAAIFLMALEPGIFGDQWYGLSTVLLLSTLVLCILYFVITCCMVLLHADRDDAWIIAAIAAFSCVQFVPAPVESYYWFNGGVYYTFFFSLSLMSAALLLKRIQRRTAAQCVLLPLLVVLLGFGNLITGLVSGVLMCGWCVLSCVKRRHDPLLWILAALYFAAFAANVFAPGNGVRQAENAVNAQKAIPAILSAIGDALRFSGGWLILPSAWLCLLPVPLLWRITRNADFRFRCPILVSIASVILLAVGFTPNEFALGFAGEMRIVDIQYYLFVLLLLLNVLWYTGWISQRVHASEQIQKRILTVFVCVAFAAASVTVISTRNMAAASALLMQTNGKARSYADTWEQRLAILRNSNAPDLVLPKLPSQPPLLCMVDITDDKQDPFYFYNEQLAAYFGKETVLCEP